MKKILKNILFILPFLLLLSLCLWQIKRGLDKQNLAAHLNHHLTHQTLKTAQPELMPYFKGLILVERFSPLISLELIEHYQYTNLQKNLSNAMHANLYLSYGQFALNPENQPKHLNSMDAQLNFLAENLAKNWLNLKAKLMININHWQSIPIIARSLNLEQKNCAQLLVQSKIKTLRCQSIDIANKNYAIFNQIKYFQPWLQQHFMVNTKIFKNNYTEENLKNNQATYSNNLIVLQAQAINHQKNLLDGYQWILQTKPTYLSASKHFGYALTWGLLSLAWLCVIFFLFKKRK